MSKQSILAIKNINLFTNENPEIQFSLNRDQKVMANFSAYDKDKGYDLRGVKQRSQAGAVYFRLVLSLIGAEGEKRQYFQGALFKNDKKESEKSPDYRGSINVTDDIKVALSAWRKTGEKAGPYLSIAISEFRSDSAAATPAPAPAGQQSAKTSDPFDMDDDAPPAPRQAPARQAAPAPAARQAPAPAPRPTPARPAPAQARQPAPAAAGGDPWDDSNDIPF